LIGPNAPEARVTPPDNLESQLLQRLKCPRCSGHLALQGSGSDQEGDFSAKCLGCSTSYTRTDGIWRMLTGEEQKQYKSFLKGYPELRRREGWERDESYFLALPNVPPGDPAAFVWDIRRRSLAVLDRLLAGEHTAGPTGGRWALDLGAGNGWLSRHLTQQGYHTVALDLTIAGLDSLTGAQLYIKHDHIWLGRVQASMSRPPFHDATFSVCSVSAALHYASIDDTLAAIYKILNPGGFLAITDSPIYTRSEAGHAMAAERQSQIASMMGAQAPALPGGSNFLVEPDLLAALTHAGFDPQIIPIERPLGRLKRTVKRALNPSQREQARFPVIIGRKR
jgi:SAM-dependent methyltransferase